MAQSPSITSTSLRPPQEQSFKVANMPAPQGVSTKRHVYNEGMKPIKSGYLEVPEGRGSRINVSTFNLAAAQSIGLEVWLNDRTIRTYIVVRQKFGGAYPYSTDAVLSAVGSPIGFSVSFGRIRNFVAPAHHAGMIWVLTTRSGRDYNGALDDDWEDDQAVLSYTIDRVYTSVYHTYLEELKVVNGGDLYSGAFSQYNPPVAVDPRKLPPPQFRRWR